MNLVQRAIQNMKTSKYRRLIAENPNTGRNDPCPCGSGVKFKKCCLPKSRGVL